MAKSIVTELEKDEAFLLLVKLQESVAKIPLQRATGVLRSNLQREIVKLADCLVEMGSELAGWRRGQLDELAILSCRKAMGFVSLLKEAAVLNEQQYTQCRSVLTQLTQLLIQRLKEWRRRNSISVQTLDSTAGHKNGRDVHSLQNGGLNPAMLSSMKKPPSSS